MSAYGEGAPAYRSVELQREAIKGRLRVARGIRDRAAESGEATRAIRWSNICDELLDRLLELRGR